MPARRPCSSGPQHPFPHRLGCSLELQGCGRGQPCWLVFDGRGRSTAVSQAPRPVRAGPLPGSRAFRDCSWVLYGLGRGGWGGGSPRLFATPVICGTALPVSGVSAVLHEDRPSAFSLVSTQG